MALQLDHHTRGPQIIGLAEEGAPIYPASRFPLRVKTQPGSSCDDDHPDQRAVVQPTQLTVSGGQ